MLIDAASNILDSTIKSATPETTFLLRHWLFHSMLERMSGRDDKERIKAQFNSEKRANEMLASYGSETFDKDIAIDPYEPLREELILSITRELSNGGQVLDIGCGIGTLIAKLQMDGIAAQGFDLAEKMVRLAHEELKKRGLDPKLVSQDDIDSFQAKDLFSVAIANGVIWYYKDCRPFLRRTNSFLEKGGYALIIHRNDLFNLFALNAGSVSFIAERLCGEFIPDIEKQLLENVEGLGEQVIKHTSSALEKTYHNPLNVHALYEECGFTVNQIRYAYIHPAPPRLRIEHSKETYREVHERYNNSWQGAFMGSQFLVVAQKKE